MYVELMIVDLKRVDGIMGLFIVLDSSTTSFNANNNKYYKARHGIFDMSLIWPGLYIGLLIVFENDR